MSNNNLYVIYESCAKGTLKNYLNEKSDHGLRANKILFYKIINGVHLLHRMGYVHGRLSLKNIYITENEDPKLGKLSSLFNTPSGLIKKTKTKWSKSS